MPKSVYGANLKFVVERHVGSSPTTGTMRINENRLRSYWSERKRLLCEPYSFAKDIIDVFLIATLLVIISKFLDCLHIP